MASLSDTMPPRSVATQSMWGYAKAGASALVLGAAFGGGLLFGAADDEEPPPEEAATLTAADASTDKLDAVREKLRLAFHAELTGPPRQEPEGAPVTPQDVVKSPPPASEAPAPPPAAAEEASSGTEPPEPPAVAQRPVAVPADSDVDDDASAPAEDEEMMAAPPRAETEQDRTRVARALAKVLGDDTPSAPAVVEQAKQIEAASEPSWAVQIASTPSEEGADALAEKLRAQGHAARVAKVELEGKGPMYRVRVGGFSTRESAVAYQAKLGEGFVIGE